MTNSLKNVLAVAVLAAFAGAGCGPSWIVVKQANPNTLLGKSFSIEAPSWDSVSIGGKTSEADWIAKRKPEEQEKFKAEWATDKSESGQMFVTRLTEKLGKRGIGVAAAAGGEAFGIKGKIDLYEPGFWSPMGWGNMNTTVVATIDFLDGAGAVQDTVKFTANIVPGITNPATGQRVRQAAENLADQIDAYLATRAIAPK